MKFRKMTFAVIQALFIVACALVCFDSAMAAAGIDVHILSWLPSADTGTLMLLGTVVAPFPVDPEMTGVAIAYHNEKYIADDILPRKPVGKQNFKYKSFPKGTFLSIPETLVGRTGKPNQVELGYTELDSSTFDHALDDPVPVADVENAPPGYNPYLSATEFVSDLIELDRELRVATMVFDANNYAAGNKVTLSGTSQFSDFTNSTPIATIQAAIDACFYRPNKAVLGRAVWTKLSQHPDIVAAVNRNSGTKGIASRRAVADLFELDDLLVGEGWYNTAKPGQTVSISRMWGKDMTLFYQNSMADTMRGVTFGITAQFGTRISGKVEDKDMGMRGGHRTRVGESVKELILANDLAYLIKDAVA